jgi:hypothetical protein
VRSTDESFLDLTRRYLESFLVPEGSVEERMMLSADCGVERRLGEMQIHGINTLYRGSLSIYRGRDRREMLGRIVSSVRDSATAHSNQFVRVRAAAIEIDGRAIVLPSLPEPRLPTLAALLVRSGARYLGDEVVSLDPILRYIHGIALPLLVDLSDLSLLPEIEETPPRGRRRPTPTAAHLRAITPRWPVSVDELQGRLADPSEIGWIVFPEFQPGAKTEIVGASGSEMVFRFTQAILNLNIWGERAVLLLRELIESLPVARMVVGSVPEAADLLIGSARSLVGGSR